MRHVFQIPFIIVLLSCALLIFPGKPVPGTTHPIPDELKQKHFYNDDLAETLSSELAALQKKFKELEGRIKKFEGLSKLKPYTHAKYTIHYTPEQVENFLKTG